MWWLNSLPSHLPLAKGPYEPGCSDVMLDYSKEGLFMRLYYPTNAPHNKKKNSKKWIPWIPDYNYTTGFANAINLYAWMLQIAIWFVSGNIHIPAVNRAKAKTDHKLKCVILSHGLAGTRFFFSSTCLELSSRGYLVAALEHRDLSSSHTYYYSSRDDARNDVKTPIEFKKISNDAIDSYEMRNKQVAKRTDECSRVLDFLFNLNQGVIPHNVIDEVPGKSECEFELKDFVGKLDVDRVVMMGYSFGGATALMTLAKRPELSVGVILDPWMFPIKHEGLVKKVAQPLIFINTQTFHNESRVRAMGQYLNGECREMYTIQHTTHESQTDSVFVVGSWFNWFMKKLNPHTAININNSLISRFLNKCFHNEMSDCEGFLNAQNGNVVGGLTKPWY